MYYALPRYRRSLMPLEKNKTHTTPLSLAVPPINPHASFCYTANRSPSSSQKHANIFSSVNWTNYNQGKDILVWKATARKKSDAMYHVQQAINAPSANNRESTVPKVGF